MVAVAWVLVVVMLISGLILCFRMWHMQQLANELNEIVSTLNSRNKFLEVSNDSLGKKLESQLIETEAKIAVIEHKSRRDAAARVSIYEDLWSIAKKFQEQIEGKVSALDRTDNPENYDCFGVKKVEPTTLFDAIINNESIVGNPVVDKLRATNRGAV